MHSDCTCDYRSQSCKAYCPLLQPVGATSCDYQSKPSSQHCSDPLRQINRCWTYHCPSYRRSRYNQPCEHLYPAGDMDSYTRSKKRYNGHNLPHEWHSTIKRSHEGFCCEPMTGSGDWNRQSMTFEDGQRYSAALRQRFMEEMVDLKVKLNYLKNGVTYEGKRLRQRSESEPASGGGIYKRAMDHSPQRKRAYRMLPNHPNSCLCCQPSHRRRPVFQRETRSVPPSMSRVQLYTPKVRFRESAEDAERYSEGESSMAVETSTACQIDDNPSEDDDYSSHSAASGSTASSTPSHVRECLGSISLAETATEEQTSVQPVPWTSTVTTATTTTADLFRLSLFSNVPPFVKFSLYDTKGAPLPSDVTKHLKWKLSSITPIVIRRTLVNSGFKLVRKSNDWTGQWGKHMSSFVFKTLKDFQKLNHFPGTFQIGRKDRLWKNLHRLAIKFGKRDFGFLPTTYILPQDAKNLRTAWEKSSGKGQWILKPPAAARGTGIRVVHKWADIPKNKPLIVQKYIAQPYLINGSKFDLRLYVLMTSIHPLRIYLYDDGLVRFASVKYSENMDSLGDRFMHLTNYSINKLSTNYCANEDASSCQGHKWTLKTLWSYLERQGVNVKELQRKVTDLVIKTLISGESHIQLLTRNNLPSRYCSYELFGIDVLLDSNLRPWLLEVNISPSLHSASPLDLAVKGPLVRELLNIAGFQIPAKLTRDQEAAYLEAYGLTGKTHSFCYDKRLYTTGLSCEERTKHASHNLLRRDEYLHSILEELTPDDVKHLIQFEDELTQISRFEKVFPTPHTHYYHQYFDSPRYYNMMFDAWETKYHTNRAQGIVLLESLCQQKIHLKVPFTGGRTKVYEVPDSWLSKCRSFVPAEINLLQFLKTQTPNPRILTTCHDSTNNACMCSQNPSDPNAAMEVVVREGNEIAEDESAEQQVKLLVRSARRSKTSVLAKPQLRALAAPRRSRQRATPDRGFNTEPLLTLLPPAPSLFQTCKVESSASASPLPPLNIRTTS